MTVETPLFRMLLDLHQLPTPPAELTPVFRQMHAGEVVALPESVIERVKQLHAEHL